MGNQLIPEVECPEPVEGLMFIYILLCKDGSFYVGQSRNVAERLSLHEQGKGAKHTRDNGVSHLIFWEGPMDMSEATKRENQLKGWSRTKKLKLILDEL